MRRGPVPTTSPFPVPPPAVPLPPPGPACAGSPARPTGGRVRALTLAGALLGITALAFACALARARAAQAGPEDARRAWERAQTLRASPWRLRLEALREARHESNRTDPLEVRTLLAEAKLLQGAGHVAAARAAEALAVALPPRHDPARIARLVSHARALLGDEDVSGARPLLEEARTLGRAGAPAAVAAALPLLARLAADAGAFESIDALANEASEVAPQHPEARLRILDLAGTLALARGDTAGARRRLDAQRRCFADAIRRQGDTADRVSKLWLALDLPRRLDRTPVLPRAP